MALREFATKDDLAMAYADHIMDVNLRVYGYDVRMAEDRQRYRDDRKNAERAARMSMTYAPHISNRGWFIGGFGYSTERSPGRVNFDPATIEMYREWQK